MSFISYDREYPHVKKELVHALFTESASDTGVLLAQLMDAKYGDGVEQND
jgi:hypothetical protein